MSKSSAKTGGTGGTGRKGGSAVAQKALAPASGKQAPKSAATQKSGRRKG